jgi:hypothetical protein
VRFRLNGCGSVLLTLAAHDQAGDLPCHRFREVVQDAFCDRCFSALEGLPSQRLVLTASASESRRIRQWLVGRQVVRIALWRVTLCLFFE